MLEHVDDLVAGDLLRVKEHVNAHVLEHELVLGDEVGFVVHTGDDPFRPQLLRQQGADDVHGLGREGIHGDEEVGPGASGVPEDLDGRRVPEDGDHIGHGGKLPQARLTVVDDGNVAAFVAEHLRQVGPHLAGPFDDDLHTIPSC